MNCLCCDGEAKPFGHYRNKNRTVQRFRCVRCHKTFSESQPLEGLRLEHGKVVLIVKLLAEGVGIRAAARLADCEPATVLSILETVGRKCADFLDSKIRNVTVESLQVDELWARVGISQKLTTAHDQQRGDFYTFLGIDAKTKLIVAHHTGKRDYGNADCFVTDLAWRINGKFQVTTDGYNVYPDMLRKHLLGRIDYAVMQKIYGPDRFNREPNRRYSPPTCIGVRVTVEAGEPNRQKVSTSYIERTNLSVRTFNRRFTRLCLGWSRKLENHRHAIALFVATHNFCKVHRSLGKTPAVAAGFADHVWTIEELIERITATI